MLEKLIEQLLALSWLKELSLDEVLQHADGTVIITADILYHGESYTRLSVQEITNDPSTPNSKGHLLKKVDL